MENISKSNDMTDAEILELYLALQENDRKNLLIVIEAMAASDEAGDLAVAFMGVVSRKRQHDSQYFSDALFVLARALTGDKTCKGIVETTLAEEQEADNE